MKDKFIILKIVGLVAIILLLLSACDSAAGGSEPAGQEAFVDGVTMVERDGHTYATVNGHYPDACSRISDVQQAVEGDTVTITLYVAKPEDMMCAQMLSPFIADILVETGGLSPGEYTVTVNEAQPATFAIGG